jgi:hypothetical protein|tara:strand:- start:156 stop:359 length:204 start_codon:yes stop_codon:yes gene_type:complete
MIKNTPNLVEMEQAMQESARIHKAVLDQSIYTNIGKKNDAELYDFLCAVQEIPQMVDTWGIVIGYAS